jgi:hypothetical protein
MYATFEMGYRSLSGLFSELGTQRKPIFKMSRMRQMLGLQNFGNKEFSNRDKLKKMPSRVRSFIQEGMKIREHIRTQCCKKWFARLGF